MIATILDEDKYEADENRIYLTGLETPITEDLGTIAEPPPESWDTAPTEMVDPQ
jgi:hypothetical protein